MGVGCLSYPTPIGDQLLGPGVTTGTTDGLAEFLLVEAILRGPNDQAVPAGVLADDAEVVFQQLQEVLVVEVIPLRSGQRMGREPGSSRRTSGLDAEYLREK